MDPTIFDNDDVADEKDSFSHGAEDASATDSAEGKRVVLVGRFGGMNQREAASVLRSYKAIIVDHDGKLIDWVIVGADESPLAEAELIGKRLYDLAAAGEIEIMHETELWQRIGLIDGASRCQRYYTPAMLAHLLGVSVRVIRRWHRRGLISPVHSLHRLPYFDFQEVTTAKRLAQWICSGESPRAIEQRLVELVEVLPDIQRPLDQLNILVEGKQILLRSGEGLLEPGGQMRFDFDAIDSELSRELESDHQDVTQSVDFSPLSLHDGRPEVYSIFGEDDSSKSEDPLLSRAYAAEDDGDFQTAIDMLHVLMGRDGPRADWCFQLGELLYRIGEIGAARERYFMTIEMDPEFVEARCSLGVILYEERKLELAIAVFRGALSLHADYPDVHYYLARTLDDFAHEVEAEYHWMRFLKLAPESPWAGEAMSRLE